MLQASDFEAYATTNADPDVTRYIGSGQPLDREQCWRHLSILVGHWHLRGYGFWGVEEKSTGNLIGRLGCWNPEGWPGFEVGWILARDAWGKGYATEGGRAAMAYAFQELGRDNVCSVIRVGNTASANVAEKLGETLDRTIEVDGFDSWIYAIDRAKWESLQAPDAPPAYRIVD